MQRGAVKHIQCVGKALSKPIYCRELAQTELVVYKHLCQAPLPRHTIRLEQHLSSLLDTLLFTNPPSAMPPQPRGPPKKLTKQQLTYFMLGLPIGFIAVSVGIVGLFIVMDAQQKTALSQTQFANLWRRAVQHNPFIQAFMLNFGAIGFGYSIVRLLEHRKALKLEQDQQQQQDQQQRTESRKER